MVSSMGEPLFLHGGIGGLDFRTPVVVIILNSGLVWVPRGFMRFWKVWSPKIVPTYG